jgi:hypothetical protein
MTNIWNKPIKEGLALKVKPKIKKRIIPNDLPTQPKHTYISI